MPSSRKPSARSNPSRPLTPSEATRLMLEKWDRMDALLQDDAPNRGRRQRASSVPNRDGERTRSRVREWERFDQERERLRLIQVETERQADEEAARKVWEGEQESRSRRRRRKASPTRSETPELLRQLESESFEWVPSRAFSVGPSVASTGSATIASRYSEDSNHSVPFASASEEEQDVESRAALRVWNWEIASESRDREFEVERGSRRGRRPLATRPLPSPPRSTAPLNFSFTTSKAAAKRPHPRHRSHSLPARSRRSPSSLPSPSPPPAHTPRSPKASSPLIRSASASDDDDEPPKTAVEAGLQVLEQLPGAIGAGLSKLLPSLFSGTATDSNGSGMGVIRAEVGGVGDLKDGEMTEVSFPGAQSKLLLCKLDGKVHATSSRSTYGATRLVNGVLSAEGIVRCRHHDAAFDVRTGAIIDGPPLAPLHTFPVENDASGSIFISTLISKVDSLEGVPPTRIRRSKEEGAVVIVGGGAAAFYLIDGLRTGGYKGGITLVERGKLLPYDRSKLSKRWVEEEKEGLLLRQATYYEKLGIDVRLSAEVVSADFEERFVALGDGSVLNFDKLIIATGATPNKDALELRRAVNPSKATRRPLRIVIIGSSYLGTELATLLVSYKLTKSRPKVTFISCDLYPLEDLLGNRLATSLLDSFTELGVKFMHSSPATAFLPSSSSTPHVGAVQLDSGERVPADLVLLAVGVKGAAPSWLKELRGIRSEDGRIEVDDKNRVKGLGKKIGVFAVGDVTYRKDKKTGQIVKSEHWNQAANQARALAHYIITSQALPPPPATIIFSSQPHPLHLLLTPSAPAWETIIILGSPDKLSCVAYYAQSNSIVSIAQFEDTKDDNGNPLLVHCKELMRRGRMLTLVDVRARKNPMKRFV